MRVKKEACPMVSLNSLEIKCPWGPLDLIHNLSLTIDHCYNRLG